MTILPRWMFVFFRRRPADPADLQRRISARLDWVVFERNGEQLWANVRQQVEDFLYNEWAAGRLVGAKPEQGYLVRCDRSTMTQYDLDNQRLVVLVGVAPIRPAEFVIFRVEKFAAG